MTDSAPGSHCNQFTSIHGPLRARCATSGLASCWCRHGPAACSFSHLSTWLLRCFDGCEFGISVPSHLAVCGADFVLTGFIHLVLFGPCMEVCDPSTRWSYGVMVSTLDFESSDPGSSPGRTSFFFSVPDGVVIDSCEILCPRGPVERARSCGRNGEVVEVLVLWCNGFLLYTSFAADD